MGIVLNEVKEAERILETGEIGNKPTYALFLLGRYFRQKEKLNKSATYKKLNEFMENNYKGYVSAQWENYVEDAAKKGTKYPLREIESISITEKEMETIQSVGGVRYEKLLFTMLCYAKFYNLLSEKNNDWVNGDIKELYSVARVTVKYRDEKFLYLNDLQSMGLISFSDRNDNLNIKVNYIYPDSPVAVEVSDFRELGYEYLRATGDDRFSNCVMCGRLLRLTGGSGRPKKYCAECMKKVKSEKNKEYYSKNSVKNYPPLSSRIT